MSLVVWLPMIKDLRNQGLADVEIINYGATFNSEGKLGGCYYFDGTNDRIAINNLSLPNVWSYSCWIYSATSSRSWEAIIMLNSTGGDTDLQLGFYTYPVGNRIQNTANGQYNSGIAWTYGVWHHFCGTFNGNSLKTYIDGVLVDTKNITASLLSRTHLTIGARCNNSTNTSATLFFQGKLNDVRIYDHCLSPMEVKQISQGLVLHYPLDNNGWGQENLVANTSSILRSGSIAQYYTELGHNSTDFFGLTTGDIATFRVYLKAPVEKKVKARIQFYTDGNNRISINGNWINAGDEGYSTITWTLTAAQRAYSQMQLLCDCNDGTTTTDTFYWKEVKLEKGFIATPWCPNSSDELATTMGMNDGIEYDCSGFGNNGEKTTTINYSSNSARYMGSYEFNFTDRSNIYFPNEANPPEEISISLWGYKNNWNAAERLAGKAASGSGWCIGDYGSENTMFGFFLQSGSGGYNTISGFRQLSSGWHHFVITFDGYNLKYYLDGECISTKTWESKQKLQVGAGKYNIGSHTNNSYFFNGNMNDFRIYATALSASDVLSLYQNSAYIDSSGNVYGAVHSEV